ncbi:isopeptide-forming domain-containing fimbrial protein [Curtobacterium sp. ZW137]|uniref:isopeptide-forming domain-containing fimbrial protein n=1 Tax=Curtobacterium sp. ZW137 TaxID=2485104 RepID=UPI000F4B2AEC|nr:isopeptide-forming domain-containing fimbrial protein [Curtobacterium sp. ZW137]ROP65064.1 fimbrial isopeptide formation D2 family protein [Curtobacterium sp. ZW137]
MNKALWSKKVLAVPACAAIVLGGVMLTALPANAAAADLSVTNTSVDGRVLTVTGTGTPGENIQLDENFRTSRHVIGDSGTWTLTYTIPGTDYDSHTYTVTQTLPNGLNQDGQTTVTAAAENPVPDFAITSHSVSGRTVTVSGTGNPDNTVQIDPQSAPIVRHQIADDGTWSFTFDIAGTDTDSHEYTVLEENNNFQIQAQGTFTAAAEATTPAFAITSHSVSGRTITVSGTGNPADTVQLDVGYPVVRHDIADDGTWSFTYDIPGTDTDSHTYTVLEERPNLSIEEQGTFTAAAEAATPAAELTLTTPKDGDTVASRTVTFTGTGTPGDAIGVLTADGTTLAAPATVVDADGNWTTTGTFSDSASTTQDLTVAEIGEDLTVVDSIDFTITLPAVATTPGGGTSDPGTGTTPGGGTSDPGTGTTPADTTPTASGTSTATSAGTTVGTLPVVSG